MRRFKVSRSLSKAITPSHTIGVPMGFYTVVDVQAAKEHSARLLSSVGFIDCVDVLICAKNDKGVPQKWALAHLTIDNDGASTIHKMIADLKKDSNSLSLECDIVGGESLHGHSKQHSALLVASVMETLESIPHMRLHNHTFDHHYRDMLAVDLKTGERYYEPAAEQVTPAHVICIMQTHYMPKNGSHKTQEAKADKKILADKLVAAAAYDWQSAISEAAKIWSSNKVAVMNTLKQEMSGLMPKF